MDSPSFAPDPPGFGSGGGGEAGLHHQLNRDLHKTAQGGELTRNYMS